MGRPPSNGGPAFRFNVSEVSEMETILQDHNNMMPAQEVLVALADKFSNSPDRQGKFVVQTKQIWNWFQNKRYSIRARTSKIPTKSNIPTNQSTATGVPMQSALVVSTMPAEQAKPAVHTAPSAPVLSKEDNLSSSRLPHSVADPPGSMSADNSQLEFEARSARDGAWYDVASFLSLKNLEAGCPEVLVRFAGFGPEEDEWINVRTHVRHRSLPCESSECVAVLPGDLILCFQEGKEQALYFDAHVLDAQRRRHDTRGCRCRFLVRYDHDQSEEIVPLRKICRRPETDYRLQQLHAMNDSSAEQRKSVSSADHIKSAPANEQHKIVSSVDQIKTDVDAASLKEGISNSVTLTDQKPPAPILLANASSLSEAPADCSIDKTTGDIITASSNTQISRPEVINLDPEPEVVNTYHEVKDATDDMDVDEQLEKAADMILSDATPETSLPVEKTDCTPMCETDSTVAQNKTEELISQGLPTIGTENASDAGQVDPDSMMVETSMPIDDMKASIDQAKDEPIASTDTSLTKEAIITLSSLPPDAAGVIVAEVDVPEMTPGVDNLTLETNVLETSVATATEPVKTDTDPINATPSNTSDVADHPIDDSGPITPTMNANTETCVEKNDDPI